MKAEVLITSFLALTSLTACQHTTQGTAGPETQTGFARAEEAAPYAVGRTGPFQHSGMPDVNIAAGRAEAGLDVSDSGSAELARRSETAAIQAPQAPPATPVPPSSITGDEIVQGRVRLALSSGSPAQESANPPLSIATLNNVQIDVHNGTVRLQGLVPSEQAKNEIDRIVRGVDGIRSVDDQLQVVAPQPAVR